MTARILELILFTLCTASLSMFLIKCMEKGMIFRKYYNWITYWLWLDKKEYKVVVKSTNDLQKVVRASFNDQFFNLRTRQYDLPEAMFWNYTTIFIPNKYQWLWKILGGCQYCFGTWMFIALYTIVFFIVYG